jgi:hypothetical protein
MASVEDVKKKLIERGGFDWLAQRDRRYAALVVKAEMLEEDIQEGKDVVAEQDKIMAMLGFPWRWMSPSLKQRQKERRHIYDEIRNSRRKQRTDKEDADVEANES